MITQTVSLIIDAPQYDQLTTWLECGELVPGIKHGELLGTFSVDCGAGHEIDLKVINSEDGPWSEAVLFYNGAEISRAGPSDVLGGEWELCDGEYNTEFTLIVKPNRYNDKLSPEDQLEYEERIAAILFGVFDMDEHDAKKASEEILRTILHKFRPDFF